MGSLFSTSVPTYSPVSYAPQATSSVSSSESSSTSSGSSSSDASESNASDTSNEDAIADVINRISRGRSSLIQTSYRGVLSEASDLTPQRKSLLGE